MSNSQTHPHSPPGPCADAREAFALELAGGPAPSAPVRAHVAACRDCAAAVARIEQIWAVPAAAFAMPKTAPDAMDRMLAGALARAQQAPVADVVSLERRHENRRRPSPLVPAAVGFALAATIAALAYIAPGMRTPPVETIAVVTPTPVAPKGPAGVRLAAAKGDVSFVPMDGSVITAPKAGDALPPGLFAATGGAALAIEGAGTLAIRNDATVLIGGTEREPIVTIARGEIFVDLPKGTIRSFFVHTPTGQVRVTGTQFGVKVGPQGTSVEVTRGSVVVTGPEGTTSVEAGQAANLKGGAVPALVAPANPAGDPLGWVRDIAPDIAPSRPVVAVSMHKTKTTTNAAGGMDEEVQEVSGLDRMAIENAMSKRDASFRRCFELARMKDPELVVRAEITFRVDEDGRAENVRVAGLPEAQMKMGLCLMDSAKAAVFPGAAAGTQVQVRYPIQFSPALP